MTFTEMAKNIIKNNKFLSLATCNNKGEVWIAPLSYSVDNDLNFYFTTAVDSIHIDHIRENPYVAFSIFNSTKNVSDIDGLQFKGVAGEVERSKLASIVPEYYKQVFPDPTEREEWESSWEHFTIDVFPVYRFFQIIPIEIYKRDTENDDVDRRVQISIDLLKEIIRNV
jgi:uncharacterized protein YhbP (UPF0306 family)